MSDCRLAEDTELVAAVAGGKDAAQAVLYDRHHRMCLGCRRQRCGAGCGSGC